MGSKSRPQTSDNKSQGSMMGGTQYSKKSSSNNESEAMKLVS